MKTPSPRARFLALSFAVSSLCVLPLSAQISSWEGSSGNYNDSANWQNGLIPEASRAVQFTTVNAAYTVQFTQDETVGRLFNRGGNVTFDLGGNTWTILAELDANSANFDSGFSQNTTVFTGGGKVVNAGAANIGGSATGMPRHVVLEGPDLEWENTGIFRVGTNTPFGGNTLSNHSLTVRDGAALSIGAEVLIAANSGASNNVIKVSGADSSFTSGNNVMIGPRNTGTGSGNVFRVEDGGSADVQGIQIGRGDNNANRVELADAGSLIQAAFVQLGANASVGNIYEQTGGTLSINEERGLGVSYFLLATASNEARFLGGDAIITRADGTAYMRAVGESSILIDGGNVTTDDIRRLANDGEILFHSGSLTLGYATYANAPSPFTVGSGEGSGATLTLADGIFEFGSNSGLVIASDGILTGNGIIEGNLAIEGRMETDGVVMVFGDASFAPGGTLRVGLDTLTAAPLQVFGPVDIDGGHLDLIADEAWNPELGASFEVISWGDRTGEFDNAAQGELIALGAVHLRANYGSTGLVLTVVDPDAPAGETFSAWADRMGLSGEQAAPDRDPAGDGVSNLVKYALGLDPLQPTPLGSVLEIAWSEEEGDEYLSIAVDRDPDAVEAVFGAEVSGDLNEWLSGVEHVRVAEETPERIVFTDRIKRSESDRRFIRLRVTLANE